MPLRVAAISFLNPAPLLYNFEHEPAASALRAQYALHYTTPARCAAQLHAGEADLGLIPVAALTPELAIVPGCTIASLQEVRSILLLVRNPAKLSVREVLRGVRGVAADTASRSSVAYARILLQRFYGMAPAFEDHTADPLAMLQQADAALLIGDPALLAREQKNEIEAVMLARGDGPLLWLDVAALWREHTGLPWVAAVWAVRTEALEREGMEPATLIRDLIASRDAGLARVDELVAEWTPRLALSPGVIHTYLTRNIHYVLDGRCMETIEIFRGYAAEMSLLPALSPLNVLGS